MKRLLPAPIRRAVWEGVWPPVGWARLGSLRRTTPISRRFGIDRGKPIDRYYIERFLESRREDIRGRVLEIGDATYTRQFGDCVERAEVLHAVAGNPEATLVGDLTTGEGVPADAFDCMILTQTFHVIYDLHAAVAHTYRALKPGGVLLATLPGISQISRYDMDRWGDYWRLTDRSARRLFESAFLPDGVTVATCGNVLAAVAFLHGLCAEELRPEELDINDPDYQLIITVRAVKPVEGA